MRGTSEPKTSVIDALYRGIGGVAPRGFEHGTGVQRIERRKRGSRRRSATSNTSEDVQSVREIIDFAKSQLSGSVVPGAPGNGPEDEAVRKVKVVETEVQRWEQKQKLLKMLTEAREMMARESNSDVHDAWKAQFEGILRKIKVFDGEISGTNSST